MEFPDSDGVDALVWFGLSRDEADAVYAQHNPDKIPVFAHGPGDDAAAVHRDMQRLYTLCNQLMALDDVFESGATDAADHAASRADVAKRCVTGAVAQLEQKRQREAAAKKIEVAENALRAIQKVHDNDAWTAEKVAEKVDVVVEEAGAEALARLPREVLEFAARACAGESACRLVEAARAPVAPAGAAGRRAGLGREEPEAVRAGQRVKEEPAAGATQVHAAGRRGGRGVKREREEGQ